jgi:hypothetical protein
MTNDDLKNLRERHGHDAVFSRDGNWHVSIGEVEDDWFDVEDHIEADESVKVWTAMGDELPNCIEILNLDGVSKITEDFILECAGTNCYTD